MASGDGLRESIEAELRSCLISVKEGVPLRFLQRDFESLADRAIPFRELGFSTLEAMLRNMPKVVRLERRGNDLVALGVANEDTAHIDELISKQRSNKPRRVARPRRPVGNLNWRPFHAPHKNYNNRPSRPPSRNSGNKSPLIKTPPYLQIRQHLQPISYNNIQNQSQFRTQNNRPQVPFRPLTQNDRARNMAAKPNDSTSSFQPPQIKPAHEIPPRFQKQSAPQTAPPRSVAPVQRPVRERVVPLQLSSAPYSQPSVKSPPLTPQLKSPTFSPYLPELVPQPAASKVTTYLPPQLPQSLVPSLSPPLVEPGLPWPNARSNKELVDNYAFVNGLKCVYRPLEEPGSKKKKRKSVWISQLILGDQKFVSYPVEMNSAEEANEEAAKRAVEKLRIDPTIVSLPIVSTRTAAEISMVVEQVRQIVSETSQGAVHYLVQEQFKKRFRMRLPSNWIELLKTDDLFRIDKPDETHFILFYDVSPRSTPATPTVTINGNSGLQEGSTGSEGEYLTFLPDSLVVPEGQYWDIYITHTSSTDNICFIFVDYYDQFQEFADAMDSHYQLLPNLTPVSYPVCGEPYCAHVDKEYRRVIVQNISEDGKQVLCDFPDAGDSEWLSPDDIFELDKKFLDLPFQALRAMLEGLACFSNDTVISEMLINKIQGKSLVAEATEIDNTIRLLLFDTTTDEDININKTLLEDIFQEVSTPSLDKTGQIFECAIGGVNPDGDVRLQVFDRSATILEQLLEDVSGILESQGSQAPVTSISANENYGVFHKEKWYRALPRCISGDIQSDKVPMLLIDSGVQTSIPVSDIRMLEGELETLASLPPLAVRCRLDGLFSDENFRWTPEATEQLLQLIPDGTRLIMKVCAKADVVGPPCVELLKRIQITEELVSINQTLIHKLQKLPKASSTKKESIERRPSRPIAPSPPVTLTNDYTSPVSTPMPLLSQSSSFFEETNRVFSPEITTGSVTPPVSLIQDMGINRQEEIPEVGEFFDVSIFSAATPNTFICRSRRALNETANLFEEMQQFYNAEENTCDMHLSLIRVGEFFAFKGEDGNWYRVHVQSINGENAILVYYVDCGNYVMAKLSDLQVLYNRFRSLPFQAIKSSLSDVKPNGVDYTTEECMIFQKMVAEKNFVSIVRAKPSVSNNVEGLPEVKLYLTLVDTSTPEDLYIHQELLRKGIAKKT